MSLLSGPSRSGLSARMVRTSFAYTRTAVSIRRSGDLWPTYTGDSVGHWEDDTLVVDTISAKGAIDGDVIVDRTGLVLSEAMHVVTRMKKIDDSTIEAQIVIEDSKALKSPWRVMKRYRRLPAGHSCL